MQSGGSGADPATTRPRRFGARTVRVLGVALVAVHLALVVWIALRPRPVPWVYDANLTPLASIRRNLDQGLWPAAKAVGGQLALLAPLGVLLPMLSARLHVSSIGSILRTTAATGFLAVCLSLAQSSVPGRMFNVDDVLVGTLGAALLHALVVPAVRRRLRRSRREAGAEAAPAGGPGAAASRTSERRTAMFHLAAAAPATRTAARPRE